MSNEPKRFSKAKKHQRKIFLTLLFMACLGLFPGRGGAVSQKPEEPSSKETVLQAPQEPSRDKNIQQIGPPPEEETKDTLRVYSVVPAGKALATSTRFSVIDDFNLGELRNKFGSLWKEEKTKEQKTELTIKRKDARDLRPGFSLHIRFNLPRHEQYKLQSSLEKLNMTKADFLVLKCRGQGMKAPFDGRVRVALSDWEDKTVMRDITDACSAADGWNDVILPMGYFKGIDLRQLSRISFFIISRNKPVSGEIGIDELAFFGPEEVGFESVIASLEGFPRVTLAPKRREALLKIKDDQTLLMEIAKDTWRYFAYGTDREHHLLVDHLKTGDFPLAATYTSPTNIAMDIMATVAARDLGIISSEDATKRVEKILDTLQNLERWKGFYYNFYEIIRLSIARPFISSVDNGWLAISLVVARQAFSGGIATTATQILNNMNFQEFLDPENNHIFIGYDVTRKSLTPYHYGLLATEARAMSLYAIGKGNISKEHWWFLYRTAPEAWTWQNQVPKGKMVTRDNVNYFQGYYTDGAKKFVPSWGGSLFEFLMPTMVIDEKNLAPEGLGLNDKIVTELHRDYALNEKQYPVWGISPAAVGSGRRWQYGEYGIKKLSVKGYPDKGVITPHVSFLALEALPQDAIQNIRKLLQYEIYGECGFYDSITFPKQNTNYQYLALDEGMVLIPIANFLKKGTIKKYFHRDSIGKNIEDLLKKEKIFEN